MATSELIVYIVEISVPFFRKMIFSLKEIYKTTAIVTTANIVYHKESKINSNKHKN